ncbi:pseudouridine synthase [Candidatus Nesciobacter abundans]|uniref:pseudouridine synthase n=1 Tax=Candidatus Nesciobacter abundans TaxID=2601668 RepID=UPI0016534561|nr:pseudouridine synthase [Candidatus Nesciobacter abundans]
MNSNLKKIAHVISLKGFTSRRKAEKLINEGKVFVNDTKVESCAIRISEDDSIKINGVHLEKAEFEFYILYKPIMYICSHNGQNKFKTIFDYVKRKNLPYLTFIGRLDYMSEGLIFLTNNSTLVDKFSKLYKRVYELRVNKVPQSFIEDIKNPIVDFMNLKPIKLLKNEIFMQKVGRVDKDINKNNTVNEHKSNNCFIRKENVITLELSEGKNREIRKLCEKHGMTIFMLKRISYGPFSLADLGRNSIKKISKDSFLKKVPSCDI